MMGVLIHLMVLRLQIFRGIVGGVVEGIRCRWNKGMGSTGGMSSMGIILVVNL